MWLLLGLQWGLCLSSLLPGAWVDMDSMWSLSEKDCLQDLEGQSVGLAVEQRSASESEGCRPLTRCGCVWLLPGLWEGCFWVTGQVPAWLGLLLDCSWERLGLSYRTTSGCSVGLKLVGLSPGTRISSAESLCGKAFSCTTVGGAGAKLQGHFNWLQQTCFRGHGWVFLLVGPWADKTTLKVWLGQG